MELFHYYTPTTARVPVLIHLPHSGTFIPEEIREKLIPEMAETQDDCDCDLFKLYEFALQLGVPIMAATHSRWVVDLNRDPKSQPLYTDGRVITGVVPSTDFNGNALYQAGQNPTAEEIDARLENYFHAYHQQLQAKIDEMLAEFGQLILLDGHSIRAVVPGIRKEKFPDYILGTNQHQSASENLLQQAHTFWQNTGESYRYNDPFSGGYITRHYGKPKQNVHALQLEMCKSNYMDAQELTYAPERAAHVQGLLHQFVTHLIQVIQQNEL